MLKHMEQRRRDDAGFTLIELMVVVLIMGILAAIAIPTFLSTRKGAGDSAAESDVTNVVTNELSYYSTNGSFMSSTDGSALDPNLPWITAAGAALPTAANQILVVTAATVPTAVAGWANVVTTGSTGLVMYVAVLASSGNCWQAFSDQNPGKNVTLYSVTTSCPATPYLGATAGTDPTITAPSGTKTGAAEDKQPAASQTWYTSW